MIRTIAIPISQKVYEKKDISKLIKMMLSEYESTLKNAEHHSQVDLDVTLVATDGSKYIIEGSEVDIELGGIIDNKNVEKIIVYFRDGINGNSFNLTLEEEYAGVIDIKSENESWFNNIKSNSIEWIEETKQQDNLFIKYRRILFHAGALLTGLAVYRLLSYVITPAKNPPTWMEQNEILVAIFLLIILYVQGSLIISMLFQYLDKLWPTIEFSFGPKHQKSAAAKRKTAVAFFTVAISPFIPDLLKIIF